MSTEPSITSSIRFSNDAILSTSSHEIVNSDLTEEEVSLMRSSSELLPSSPQSSISALSVNCVHNDTDNNDTDENDSDNDSVGESNVSDDSVCSENDDNRWVNNPIHRNSTVRGGDALYQILKIYVSNRLTKKTLDDLSGLLNLLLPEDHTLPKTKFKLLKTIDTILPPALSDFSTKHRICSECYNYLGKWSDSVNIEICPRCKSKKLKSYFLEFSLETELRNAFEVRDLHILIDSFQNECAGRNPEKCYDLTSGSEYTRLKLSAIPGQYDLCMVWYTDGVQISKSGKSHIWPIYAQIVNVAPRFRKSFQFVCGIFYSNRCSKKPDMNSYLKPFASTLENLSTNGFEWRNQSLNLTVTSKLIAPVACLDAPARAVAQNIMSYNGEYGCSNCETKGESCETGAGSNWIFPIVPNKPVARSADRMEKQTAIVETYKNLKHFRGVKGNSIVTRIPYFDRSKGFVSDYMHAVLLGVMLMLLNLWCSSNNNLEDYYLPKEVRDEIDEILEKIAPPDDVTRTPRKLSDLSDWKASEIRAFLVYHGPVVLKNRLNDDHFQHFLILVKAVHLLSKEEISVTEIDLAETLLNIFAIDVEPLYGRNKCSYNVHQLLHLPDFVRFWGPLWVWSAFSSEDQNGELVRMTHGSNRIDIELSNTVKLIQAYRCIQHLIYPERIVREPQCQTHGPSVSHDITVSELEAISHATHVTKEQLLAARLPIFSRCIINDEVYTSKLYTRQKKRANFYVTWEKDGSVVFGYIKYVVKVEQNAYTVLSRLIVTHDNSKEIKNREMGFNLNDNIKHVRDSYCIDVIPLNKIISKVLRVENYICTFINNMEKK